MKKSFSEITLQVNHIQKSYCRKKVTVLNDINLTAHKGECIGILGANGCGKSTLLSILAGIQKPNLGNILHYDHVIGYVPQNCPLIDELNAMDNLKLWYCNSALSLKDELQNGFLAMLGIPDFLHVTVKNMSGGMKKRLSIGCSIAKSPSILLLDEPGAALDLICKERIDVYLRNYKSLGNTIILATHEEREIELCDTLYLLKNGILEPFSYDGNIHHIVSQLVQ